MIKKLLVFSLALVSFYAESQSGDALNFDGTNDYVLLPASVPSLGTGDCTFEAWVYPKLNTTNLQMILAKDQFGDPNSQFRLAHVSGSFKFSMSDISNANVINIISPAYPINNWYHVAAVRQGTVYTLYVNGAVVSATTTPVVMNSNNPAHPWSIGARKPFAQDPFNGSIDELRIWNVARTKCEINTYMNCEIPNNSTGLIANYHFNQGSAAGTNTAQINLTDNTSAANTGTLMNFALTGITSNWISPGGVLAGSVTPLAPISVSATISNSIVCSGKSTAVTASGANSYTWSGGVQNGVTFIPLSSGSFTVTGTNTLTGCTNSAIADVTVIPTPTVTVNSGSLCSGQSFTISPGGAVTYTIAGGSAVVSPSVYTNYIVIGTAANGCTAAAINTINVFPTPTITAFSSQTAICIGQGAIVNALGAASYSWNGTASASSMAVSPTVTTVYTVSGAAANSCVGSKTISIIANTLPSVSISPSRNSFCIGEKIILTANGANTYTWISPGLITMSIQVSPSVTTTYSLNATNIEGCVNGGSFQLSVSPCTGVLAVAPENQEFSIYPNPSSGELTLRHNTEVWGFIINDSGTRVASVWLNENNSFTMNINNLDNGIYFFIGNDSFGQITSRIVIFR